MASQTQILDVPRRIVTTHTDEGVAVVQSDTLVQSKPSPRSRPGQEVNIGILWTTNDGLPTNDNNTNEDGAQREVEGSNLAPARGANVRYVDLGPGASIRMHRTTTVDYNILIQGELVLIMEDGTETHLKTPGDSVVQKGTIHGWKNPGTTWTRWACILMDAHPAIVGGQSLGTSWGA